MNSKPYNIPVPEILPPKNLERGSIGTLDEELERSQERVRKLGGFSENLQMLEIDPILEAKQEGYKYIGTRLASLH